MEECMLACPLKLPVWCLVKQRQYERLAHEFGRNLAPGTLCLQTNSERLSPAVPPLPNPNCVVKAMGTY